MAPYPSAAKADADVILNKVNLALAKNQRLLATVLPPRKTSETVQKPKAELEREELEEREFHTAVPEL